MIIFFLILFAGHGNLLQINNEINENKIPLYEEEKCKSFFAHCVINMTVSSKDINVYCFCIVLLEYCQKMANSSAVNYTIAAKEHCDQLVTMPAQPILVSQKSSIPWFTENAIYLIISLCVLWVVTLGIIFVVYLYCRRKKNRKSDYD